VSSDIHLSLAVQVGSLAQKRLARGLKLNRTEAIALIASVLHERIRDGNMIVTDLMKHGKEILGRRHVLPGVVSSLESVQVEGTFHDGYVALSISFKVLMFTIDTSVFLVTVHDPICTNNGNITNALYGSFLPLPKNESFTLEPEEAYSADNAPGAVVVGPGPIVVNKGRESIEITVRNDGDRPIQVRSPTASFHSVSTPY